MHSIAPHFKADIPESIETQIRSLSMDALSVLADVWGEMNSLDELQTWLAANR